MLNQSVSHQESMAPSQPGCPPGPAWLLGPCLRCPFQPPETRGAAFPRAGGCPRHSHLPGGCRAGESVELTRAKGQGKVKLGVTHLTPRLQSACAPSAHVQCLAVPAQGVFLSEQRALRPYRRKQTRGTGCRPEDSCWEVRLHG